MTGISIKDLPQSEDLDRAAMRSIVGGAHGLRASQALLPETERLRILNYPPGFGTSGPQGKSAPGRG